MQDLSQTWYNLNSMISLTSLPTVLATWSATAPVKSADRSVPGVRIAVAAGLVGQESAMKYQAFWLDEDEILLLSTHVRKEGSGSCDPTSIGGECEVAPAKLASCIEVRVEVEVDPISDACYTRLILIATLTRHEDLHYIAVGRHCHMSPTAPKHIPVNHTRTCCLCTINKFTMSTRLSKTIKSMAYPRSERRFTQGCGHVRSVQTLAQRQKFVVHFDS